MGARGLRFAARARTNISDATSAASTHTYTRNLLCTHAQKQSSKSVPAIQILLCPALLLAVLAAGFVSS